ncbi:MAG: hypothetical protein QOC62_3526 [Mycobacterium sp.]|nr:hypothetical protein [Mycobacterium sp.]
MTFSVDNNSVGTDAPPTSEHSSLTPSPGRQVLGQGAAGDQPSQQPSTWVRVSSGSACQRQAKGKLAWNSYSHDAQVGSLSCSRDRDQGRGEPTCALTPDTPTSARVASCPTNRCSARIPAASSTDRGPDSTTPKHIGRIAADRSRRTVGQIDHQQQHAVPPLERLRRQQPTEQRVRLSHHPHLTRQDRTQLLQSVAFTAGTDESHTLVGVGIAAIHAGHKVGYFTAADLIETLYRGLADKTLGKIIESLLRVDLIILDELGFAPLDDTGTQLLFRLVVGAYESRSLAVGSR